jgi:hypothetical protein
MLILKTLNDGPMHGCTVGLRIRALSQDISPVKEGSGHLVVWASRKRNESRQHGHSLTRLDRRTSTHSLKPDAHSFGRKRRMGELMAAMIKRAFANFVTDPKSHSIG